MGDGKSKGINKTSVYSSNKTLLLMILSISIWLFFYLIKGLKTTSMHDMI